MSSLLQKDFHIITINYKPRSNIIDADNSYERKTFFINISIVFSTNVSLSFIVYNT